MANIPGSQNADNLTGTSSADSLVGFQGNDTVSAGGGADSVWAGAGNDNVAGGAGDDVLRGDADLAQMWSWRVYDRNFNSNNGQAPNIENGTLRGSGIASSFDVNGHALAARGTTGDPNDFGVVYTSTFTATTAGSYRFSTTSDDGSTIIIRNAAGTALTWTGQTTGQTGLTYMNNDFHQSAATRSGSVTLAAGETYTIEVRFWENEGSNTLSATVTPPGGTAVDLASSPYIGSGIYAGNDTLSGDAGNDTIYGEGGNDSLSGGTGDDLLYGGDGADVIVDGTGADQAYGGAGNDTITLGADTDGDIVWGDDGADVITTTHTSATLADTVYGGAGNDTITGGSGIDLFYGDAGADVLSGGAGNDTLYGGADNDSLSGGDGADLLDGGDGADTLLGEAGNDTLMGSAGADVMSGGSGMDYADYSGSSAAVSVDLASGTGSGGHAEGDSLAGIDGLYGSAHDDTLRGYDGQSSDPLDGYTNIFYGGAGNDILDGRGGDDQLYGGADNDTLIGGSGNDLMEGGTGSDSFVLTSGSGTDTITGGENAGDLDVLDASALTTATTLTYSGAEGGSLTGSGLSASFAEIERVQLGQGDDTVLATSGLGPASVGGGAGTDTLTIGGQPVNRADITLDDTASGTFSPGNGAPAISFGPGHAMTLSQVLGSYKTGAIQITGSNLSGSVGDLSFDGFETINVDIICFCRGTRIATATGDRPVEDLRPGDLVLTRDHGLQPLRWAGGSRRLAAGALAPVRIGAGALGNTRDLRVSPQHRMLVDGWQVGLLFGEDEVLVPAISLVNGTTVTRDEGGIVEYFHLLFDRHEILLSDGAPSESFHPGDQGWKALDAAARDEILLLFPELADHRAAATALARPCLRAFEGRALAALLWPDPPACRRAA
ncbi:Hint domain-containing protein [Gemmobacter sp.]|uniref:Hint domain-containing protein n=1 Tax=Gemmobacter sp. TaxID=1898957 RepID=UPI002AFEDDFF|nr:Hint domain-containing protein [Gemmobacter sp.]